MVDGKMFFKIKCLRLQNAKEEEREIETIIKKREGQILRLVIEWKRFDQITMLRLRWVWNFFLIIVWQQKCLHYST